MIEIYASTKLSQLWASRKLKNKLRAYRQIISQLTKAKSLIKKEANRKSLVICWSIMTGMLSQFVIPKHVPVFSLYWLTPDKRPVNTFLKKRMLNRSTFFVFADSKGTKEEIIDYYSPKSINNIYVFPDTFNYLGEFRNLSEDDVEARRRKRICFTGGRNNRDWNCFIQTARLCPDINFIGIGIDKDQLKETLPDNVTLYNKTNEDFYYSTMNDAYLVYLPLNDRRAAGAINIFRAAMNQQICLITDAPSTSIYFPLDNHIQLLPIQDAAYNASIIKQMFSLSDDDYIKKVNDVRNHLLASFSSNRIASDLSEIINKTMNNC